MFPVPPCEAAVPPLPQHDRACTPARLRETAAGEPTLEPAVKLGDLLGDRLRVDLSRPRGALKTAGQRVAYPIPE